MGIPSDILNTITTGDARELAARIPDASIDLIFTDPIYSERELYDWLGVIARRVLKPSGALLCWSNGKWHHQNARWLEDAGLTYRYDFGCVIGGAPAPMNGKIISKTNRLIWLDTESQSKITNYLADGYMSMSGSWGGAPGWKWTKNPIFCNKALEAFSKKDDLVFDPFCGEGTLPAVSRFSGRNYIAFEIDPETAARARIRVEHTQAMHPAFLEEQAVLVL